MKIGKIQHNIILSDEYANYSKADELSADLLAKQAMYEQACYFVLQAMEKALRAKIFTKVNANNEYFRNRNRSHSIGDAIEFFVDIVSGDDEVKKTQIKQQLETYVIKGARYEQLHNNLRYPWFSERYSNYSKLLVTKDDFNELKSRIIWLRKFLNNF